VNKIQDSQGAFSRATGGCNRNTRIQYQSHSGGFSGSRWLLMISSRSLPKSSSSVACEPRTLASAMHSSMGRPRNSGALNHSHRFRVSLDNHLDVLAHLLQHRVQIARQFGFGHVDLRHIFDHTLSRCLVSCAWSAHFGLVLN
jgi:hypothetical protein